MNWCMLLVVTTVSCPWSRSESRTYYWSEPAPVYVTCQPTPVCTYPSTMVCGPVVAEVCEESQPVAAAKAEESETVAASATEEEEDEAATEFVDFSAPAPYGGGDAALGWGIASIGAGTLYPTPQGFLGGSGFFPYRGYGNSNGSSSTYIPGTTIINNIISNNSVIPTDPGGGPGPNPVPEPASILAWIVGIGAAGYTLRRRKRSAANAG